MSLHSVLISNKAEKKQYKSSVHLYAQKSMSEYISKMNTAKWLAKPDLRHKKKKKRFKNMVWIGFIGEGITTLYCADFI